MRVERRDKSDATIGSELCRSEPSTAVTKPGRRKDASPSYRKALDRLESFARFERGKILIEGESGTGKSLLARHVHASSPRAHAALVELDLGALDEALVNSELFGHKRGSFTGASSGRTGLVLSANRGTLFLDEIGKASLHVQQRLLALLDRRVVRPVGSDREVPIDVRFVAASNIPREQLVDDGKLLPDLLPRLAAFRVRLPPLRDRAEDIRWLADECIARHARHFGFQYAHPILAEALVAAMLRARWPHNVRGLDNVIQRLLVAANGEHLITLDHCMDEDLIFLRHATLCDVRLPTSLRRKDHHRRGSDRVSARWHNAGSRAW